MFERAHHQHIARVLACLNPVLLSQHHCLFGGGTAMALRFGEYRESVDIDFLVSELAGFRQLRQCLTGPEGIHALCTPEADLRTVRDMRADQYGIRTIVEYGEVRIKFEIVLEARIKLQTPGQQDTINGVACLTPLDMASTKLQANSDRWADDSVFSRDLMDLAMMQASPSLRKQAIAKASEAYGHSIETDLGKAISYLLDRPGRLERCMQALQMTVPKAVLWQRLQGWRPKPDATRSP